MKKSRTFYSRDEFSTKTNLSPWNAGPVVIADEQIVPHFQPIISVTSGRIVGYECLARSVNTDGNFRSFGHFFFQS